MILKEGAAMQDENGAVEARITDEQYLYTVTVAKSAERVWRALVDESESAAWYYGTSVRSSWEPGARYEYVFPNGTVAIEGILEGVTPGRKVVMSFKARWDPDVARDESSRVVW
jgi:uncharacterized protein YndB with AHSA1/START domain